MREINVSESFQKTGETLSERTIAHLERSVGPAIPFYYGRSFFTGDDMPSDFRQYEYKKIRSGMDRYLDTRHLVEFMVRSRVNPNIHVRKDEVGFFQGGVNQFTDRILARLKRIENLREMGLTVDPYKMLMKVDQKNAFFWTAMVMELDVYRLLFGGELKEHSRGEITVLFNRIINSEGGDLCDAIKWLRFELP